MFELIGGLVILLGVLAVLAVVLHFAEKHADKIKRGKGGDK